jgi:hypothetical protein
LIPSFSTVFDFHFSTTATGNSSFWFDRLTDTRPE